MPLRRAGVPEALVPRGEDAVTFGIEATGDAAHPEVHAKLVGAELGFRFGRPRFQPALLARALEVVLDVPAAVGGAQVARLRGSVRLSAGTLAIEGDVPLVRDAARSIAVRATDLEPIWVAAVAGALSGTSVLRVEEEACLPAGSFAIPRDARFAAEVVVDVGGGSAMTTTGLVTMTTPRGALAAQPLVFRGGAFDGTSLRGRVAFADTLRMNLFPSDVRPLPHGWLDVDLALSGAASALVLKGTLAAQEVRLSIASRPDASRFSTWWAPSAGSSCFGGWPNSSRLSSRELQTN